MSENTNSTPAPAAWLGKLGEVYGAGTNPDLLAVMYPEELPLTPLYKAEDLVVTRLGQLSAEHIGKQVKVGSILAELQSIFHETDDAGEPITSVTAQGYPDMVFPSTYPCAIIGR